MADCEARTFEPHQQRVVDERRELDEKRQRLSNFFGTATFEGLPPAEKTRLRMQYDVMGVYSGILTQRIVAF